MDFMSLPLVMIENILSYLSFDEIAKCRLVSRSCNEICSRMLNRGFCHVERRNSVVLKHVKAQLPRRESERRNHQLARHCDILTSIETRLSMLNMTYSKFIDLNMCCFIPGKVIDEIRRILILVETETDPPRPHEVLRELRDISSMAIEHFDDKISPTFRKKLQESAAQPARPSHSVLAPFLMRQEMAAVRRRSLLNAKMSFVIASQYRKLHKGVMEHKIIVSRQQRTIKQMMRRLKEQDSTIAELKKRIDECDVKCSEMTHTNVGGKAITSEVSTSSQPLRHFSSQIKLDLSVLPIGTSKRTSDKVLPNMKPRKPTFKLPSLSDDDAEPPRKVLKTEPKNKGLAQIEGISQEISKHLEGTLKRTSNVSQNNKDCKKQKMD